MSPLPSYAHASVALAIAALVACHVGAEHLVFEFHQDQHISDTENGVKQYIQLAAVYLIILAGLVVFSSFKLRHVKFDKKRSTYRRWFVRRILPKVYVP